MSNFKKSILIFGALILCIAVALGTFLVLSSLHMFTPDPIAVEFTVVDGEKVYDGKPLSADWYYITQGELLQGHRAVVSYEGSITDVGETESDMSVRIKDAKGVDVTDLYAIKVVGGTLKVTENVLSVEIPGMETVYNGQYVEVETFELLSGSLGVGHTLMLDVPAGINAGDRLTFDEKNLRVYDAVGRDVTYNYRITCGASDFTILKRPITVSPVAAASKMYDGTAIAVGRYEILSGSLAPDQHIEATVTVERTVNGGATGPEKGLTSITAFGSYVLFIGEDKEDLTIYDKEGNDVTDNYSITRLTETVEIEQRPLTLTVQSSQKFYDGVAVTPTAVVTYGSLASYHTLTSVPIILPEGVEELRNAGTYKLEINEQRQKVVIVDRNGVNVAENYAFTYQPGDVTIDPCPLTFLVHDHNKTYDADAVKPSYELVSGKIASGQSVREGEIRFIVRSNSTGVEAPVMLGESCVLNADTYTVELDASTVQIYVDEGGRETDNYDLHFVSGTYTVLKRALTVKGSSKRFTYDGTAHFYTLPDGLEYEEYEDIDHVLLESHIVYLDYYKKTEISVTKVSDEKDNEFRYRIWQRGTAEGGDAVEVTDNYAVTAVCGKLTVEYLHIDVTLQDYKDVYTGDTFAFGNHLDDLIESIDFSSVDWSDDVKETMRPRVRERLALQSYFEETVQDVGAYRITAALTGDWQANCRLTVERCTLTITPKTVYLRHPAATQTLEYGDVPTIDPTGLTLYDDEGDLGLTLSYIAVQSVDYDRANKTATATLREPTIVDNETGVDVTKNYILRCLVGEEEKAPYLPFTLTPRLVKIVVTGGPINEDRWSLFVNGGGWKQTLSVAPETPLVTGDLLDLSAEWGTHNLRYNYNNGTLYIRKEDVHISRNNVKIDGCYEITSVSETTFTFTPGMAEKAFQGDFPIVPSL